MKNISNSDEMMMNYTVKKKKKFAYMKMTLENIDLNMTETTHGSSRADILGEVS